MAPPPDLKQVVAGVGVLALYMLVTQLWHYSSPFYWHPLLMTAGFAVFMAHGVMLAGQARVSTGEHRTAALWQHTSTQVLALLCVASGFGAIYYNKTLLKKPHFTTPHGQLGLCVMLLACAVPALGAVSFRSLAGGVVDDLYISILKPVHRALGFLLCIAGCAAAATGVWNSLSGWAMYTTVACYAVLVACLVLQKIIGVPWPIAMHTPEAPPAYQP